VISIAAIAQDTPRYNDLLRIWAGPKERSHGNGVFMPLPNDLDQSGINDGLACATQLDAIVKFIYAQGAIKGQHQRKIDSFRPERRRGKSGGSHGRQQGPTIDPYPMHEAFIHLSSSDEKAHLKFGYVRRNIA
jgi:hypothetical protein